MGGAIGQGALLKDSAINKIVRAHGKSAVQVILRWHIQEDFFVIPGVTILDCIKENTQIFHFALTGVKMAQMRSLDKEKYFFNATLEEVERMMQGMKQ